MNVSPGLLPVYRSSQRCGRPAVGIYALALGMLLSSPLLRADEYLDDTADANLVLAESLVNESGIATHLTAATQSILEETQDNFANCKADENDIEHAAQMAQLESLVEEHFGPKVMYRRAIDAMADELATAQLTYVSNWFSSEIGQRIIAAETLSNEFSESAFSQQANSYLSSKRWTEDRERLMQQVADTTRAARFISLVYAEVTVAVQVSSICDASTEGYEALNDKLESVRKDSQLFEGIAAADIVKVTGTVFRDLTDAEIAAYIDFLSAPSGQAYISALLDSTQAAIAGGLKPMRNQRMLLQKQREQSVLHWGELRD